MRADALRETLARLDGPIIVCAQSGNVNTGAFDPLDEIVARRPRAAERLAARGRRVRAVGRGVPVAARSRARRSRAPTRWTTDAHKWLNVPYDSRHRHRARDPRGAPRGDDARRRVLRRDRRAASATRYNWVAESSRRARGFPIYAALRSLGRHGLAEMVDRCCAPGAPHGGRARRRAGVAILNDVVLNQVLVRFAPPGSGRRRRDRRFTREVIAARPGRRHVLARRDDLARHGRDAHLRLQLVDDRGRRGPVRRGDPPLRSRRRGRRRRNRHAAIGIDSSPTQRHIAGVVNQRTTKEREMGAVMSSQKVIRTCMEGMTPNAHPESRHPRARRRR